MLAKLANPRFPTDMKPVLPIEAAERMTEAAIADSFRRVFTTPWTAAGRAMGTAAGDQEEARHRLVAAGRLLVKATYRLFGAERAALARKMIIGIVTFARSARARARCVVSDTTISARGQSPVASPNQVSSHIDA